MTIAKRIPPGWKSVTLGDVVTQRKENVQPSGEGTDRFVGLEHITPGTVKLDTWAFDTDLRSTKSKFYSGDLLYGKLRPYLDKAVKADFDGICSTDILVLTPTIEKESSPFILYTIHSKPFIDNAMSSTSGTNHPRTSWKAISSFEFALPPRDERIKISSILTTVDEAIQKSRAATAGTERLKEGAMRELFTKGIGHIEFEKNETIGIKPKDWTVKTIIDIFEVKTGSTPSTKIKEYWKDGIIKWYTPADLSYVNEKIYTEDSEKCITKKALEETNVNLVPKDTVIISTRAPVGTLGITKQKATFNQGCKGLVPRDNPNIDSLFYYYYLLDSRKSLENRSGGSTFMELSKDMLESFPVPSPLIAEKTQIATILSTIDRKLSLQRQRTAALERLKKGLMDDLLTGRRRVVIR